MFSSEKLQKELELIQKKLLDPESVSDYKKTSELSKRYAEINRLLIRTETNDFSPNAVIVEIRAGTGGEEAALFAAVLLEMYKKYAASQGWQTSLIDANRTDLGGYKNIVFEINGRGVWEKIKNESGVHRVQRIPKTEKSGRIHTSTATVAVLPKAEETDIEIKPDEIEISFFRSSGPGGQNVNKVSTAVRILHRPSGIIVSSREERFQARNKERALEILRAKLLNIKRMSEEESEKSERRRQIGSAERAEKIRTYNFSQDRITDHRIKKSWSNIEKIMNGGLEPIIEDLNKKLVG